MKMEKSIRGMAMDMMCHNDEKCEAVEPDRRDRSLIGEVISEMGGVPFVIGAVETVLHNAAKFFPDNKKYQSAVKTARGAIPAYVLGRQLWHVTKKVWRQNKSENEETPFEKRKKHIAEILNMEYDETGFHTINLGDHIGEWICSLPENELFRIVKVELMKNGRAGEQVFQEVNVIDEDGGYLITADIDGDRMVIDMNRHTTRYSDSPTYNTSFWWKTCADAMEMRLAVVSAFIADFNIRENTIHCTTLSLEARKRQKISFPVYQCTPDFVKEVKRALKMEERRTYALIGEAGCGKTTSLLAIIDKFRDVPIITTNCKSINNVIGAFLTAQAAAPCLVVLEDIDQMELMDKSSKDLGILIGLLDSSYDMSQKIVTVMTLNEPQHVHPCLMSRRGRIDRVMHFGPPKTLKEVREVLNNCSKEVFGRKERWFSSKKHVDLLENIIENGLTHSDIRELINWCKLNSPTGRATQQDIRNGYKTLLDSINNVNKFINRETGLSTGKQVMEDENEYPSVPGPIEDFEITNVVERIVNSD